MRYKKFKNAEIEVSQLAVGTWAIGGQNYGKVDKNEAICAIRRMIENGVNLIALIVKVVVSKNLYFLFVQVIRYCSVPDVSINK